jgi:cellulose synthase/poly-beta-1,6-N-acetylglucosamine synthase-like glycosyltransferase
MRFLFFFSLFMLFYVYLGYPMLISLLGLIRNKKVKKAPIQPLVTILIAAYNEERDIEKTIKNKLELDYSKEKLEIIVVSDGSTDKTEEIIAGFKDKGVRLLKQSPRAGKTSALNMAIPVSKGEIIVFSDANSIYDRDAVRKLVANFADPSVGYVTGKMVYTNPDGSMVGDGCTAYMKYENLLREFETRIGSVVGVDGGIDAIRKSLYQPMKADQLPDFVLPLKVIEQGYRVVYEPLAILNEHALTDAKDEYKMRVRVSLRALWALRDMRKLLSIKKFGAFAWQIWSHKVLRYLCFLFLAGAYVTNLALWPVSSMYKAILGLQTLAYLCAIFYPTLGRLWSPFRVLYFLNYFALLNTASAHAFLKFLMGQKQAVWTPRKG